MRRYASAFILFLSMSAGPAPASSEDRSGLPEFLARRAEVALALSEPIAACVERQDTSHPVFHGCIDWHSSVHGTWALIAYGRMTGDGRYRALVERMLEPAALGRERADLAAHPTFEMPYGRAWFLRLAIDDARAGGKERLAPLAEDVAASLVAYYEENPPDPLSVAYDNASWALINLHDYGLATGSEAIVTFVKEAVRAHYLRDVVCPVEAAEIDTPEFMAVCTNWAWLVGLVLAGDDYRAWLGRFLPGDPPLTPITTPVGAHQSGLNFSRAWGLWQLYRLTGEERFLRTYLAHFEATYDRPRQWKGDYRTVAHWVAQFGMFALTRTYDDPPTRN